MKQVEELKVAFQKLSLDHQILMKEKDRISEDANYYKEKSKKRF